MAAKKSFGTFRKGSTDSEMEDREESQAYQPDDDEESEEEGSMSKRSKKNAEVEEGDEGGSKHPGAGIGAAGTGGKARPGLKGLGATVEEEELDYDVDDAQEGDIVMGEEGEQEATGEEVEDQTAEEGGGEEKTLEEERRENTILQMRARRRSRRWMEVVKQWRVRKQTEREKEPGGEEETEEEEAQDKEESPAPPVGPTQMEKADKMADKLDRGQNVAETEGRMTKEVIRSLKRKNEGKQKAEKETLGLGEDWESLLQEYGETMPETNASEGDYEAAALGYLLPCLGLYLDEKSTSVLVKGMQGSGRRFKEWAHDVFRADLDLEKEPYLDFSDRVPGRAAIVFTYKTAEPRNGRLDMSEKEPLRGLEWDGTPLRAWSSGGAWPAFTFKWDDHQVRIHLRVHSESAMTDAGLKQLAAEILGVASVPGEFFAESDGSGVEGGVQGGSAARPRTVHSIGAQYRRQTKVTGGKGAQVSVVVVRALKKDPLLLHLNKVHKTMQGIICTVEFPWNWRGCVGWMRAEKVQEGLIPRFTNHTPDQRALDGRSECDRDRAAALEYRPDGGHGYGGVGGRGGMAQKAGSGQGGRGGRDGGRSGRRGFGARGGGGSFPTGGAAK